MSQFLRPDGDVAQDGGWETEVGGSTLFISIDESEANDGDYVWHNAVDAGDYFEVAFSDPGETPGAGPCTIRWRLQRIGGSNGTQVKCELRQGAVVKVSQEVAITDAVQALSFIHETSGVTDWKSPGTAANVDRDGKWYWSEPYNAKVDDGSVALFSGPALNYGDWLRVTNFGFATNDIPDGATILGIEVDIEGWALHADKIYDHAIYLRDSIGQVGDNKADLADAWSASSTGYDTHGGSSDTWNSGLSDSDIRDSNFGVDVSVINQHPAGTQAYVDHIRVRVHWEYPISDWTDLRLRFTIPSVTKKGDDPAIMWAEMEVPDAGAPPSAFIPIIIGPF